MTVYNINKSIGRASSGVEYAQAYRNKVLRKIGVDQKYIFTDYIEQNLLTFTDILGFEKEEIIWIYSFLANRTNQHSSLSLDVFQEKLVDFERKEIEDEFVIYAKGILEYKLWKTTDGFISAIDMLVNEKLYKRMYYTNSLAYENYYQEGTLTHRVFYDDDEQIAYTQYYENKEIQTTMFSDRIIFGKQGFLNEFFEKLAIEASDFLIIDRNLDLASAVFKNSNGAKTAVVIHAEHFNHSKVFDDYLLWNNHYEYPFTNHKYVDYFITATQKQKKTFTKQMSRLFGETFKSKVVAIPVGSAEEYSSVQTSPMNQYKLITASRLADEKHVDDLVKAVIQAKPLIPELSFSIYGEGKHRNTLLKLIKENNASDYIKLMGHHELTEIYRNHGVYVSASLSEGFGLSLLEALSNGLVFIGYDVDYGNAEFMIDGKNAIKIHYEKESLQSEVLKNAILSLYGIESDGTKKESSFDIESGMEVSYELSKAYTADKIKNSWEEILIG